MGGMRDWVVWHEPYDDPSSVLSARLRLVQAQLADALDHAPAGAVRLLSLCAGQGRDVIGVLPSHPRQDDVSAVLIEADPENAETARGNAAAAGLAQVEVRQADASRPSGYADVLPADVLLLCGIFGNVGDADIQRTVAAAPALCAPGATVIWTRHRRPPDLTPQVRAWFRRPLCGVLVELTRECTEDSGRRRTAASRGSQRPRRRRFAGRPGRPGQRGGTARRATVHFPFEDARSAPGMSSACWISTTWPNRLPSRSGGGRDPRCGQPGLGSGRSRLQERGGQGGGPGEHGPVTGGQADIADR